MLIILMLILVVLFAFVQQIINNLYVLYILCLDHFYFAGVPRIIVFSRVPHTHKSLPARTHTRTSRVVPQYSRGSAGLYTAVLTPECSSRVQSSQPDLQMPSGALIHVPHYLGNLPLKVWRKMQDMVQNSESGEDLCSYTYTGNHAWVDMIYMTQKH